ncbi:MAG: glycosyltransferase [Rhodospirillaceae bacterium]|jgi:glycosyltransferase involved in cell wall biosynthesis|nr:glycosyltransferase [Rhodospirillaceae bacterium]MBT5565115.1 glycosyltransferase [Rhodospirillaceae bacterium]MBT6088137.1 glycosyltransferase [Rhodospirillaceae bacterium]MBT6959840.1 glycosyltransferase [Rhodospirillaceae bacterium]MBT7450117.1 glycosyltransferase [Rhodospirillaceae bacterium]
MRLLHTIAGGRHGGAERFFIDLVAALTKRGVDQHAVSRPHAERLAQLTALECGVTPVKMGGPFDLWSQRTANHAATAFAPEISLAWMNRGARFSPQGPWITVGRLGGYYDLKYYRECDHLVCNTPDLVQHCVDHGWPQDRVDYIPNFSPAITAEPVDRESLATPDDASVLLVLARLEKTKAIDVAITSLTRLPEPYLWIAGNGSCEKELRDLATSLGVADRVRFLGWRDDREALLAAADICLVPSRHEPFGNVVVNAWASRTPVIAAASEGPSFLISHEKNGMLAPVDDPMAMADAIIRVLTDEALARSLVVGGDASTVEAFSEDAVVSAYISLFKRLIG